jgi:hypothetical protein
MIAVTSRNRVLEIGSKKLALPSPSLAFPTPLSGVGVSTHQQVPDWSIKHTGTQVM